MKPLLALLASVLLGIGATACGSSGKDAHPPSGTTGTATKTSSANYPPAPAETKADADKDDDLTTPNDDTNNDEALDYGHPANASDRTAIAALVRTYMTAADAENGAAACSMLYSTLAESIVEDYGQSPPGQPFTKGSTCAQVMTQVFRHFHPQIALELPRLKVTRVRLIEHKGLAILNVGKLPEREMSVSREGHVWKLESMTDTELP
jgi:hypothetical protein